MRCWAPNRACLVIQQGNLYPAKVSHRSQHNLDLPMIWAIQTPKNQNIFPAPSPTRSWTCPRFTKRCFNPRNTTSWCWGWARGMKGKSPRANPTIPNHSIASCTTAPKHHTTANHNIPHRTKPDPGPLGRQCFFYPKYCHEYSSFSVFHIFVNRTKQPNNARHHTTLLIKEFWRGCRWRRMRSSKQSEFFSFLPPCMDPPPLSSPELEDEWEEEEKWK